MSLSIVAVAAALLLTQNASVIGNSANRQPGTSVSQPGQRVAQAGRGAGEAREERVCRQERIIGSNFSRRVCRARGLNAQARDDSQDGLRELQGVRTPDGR